MHFKNRSSLLQIFVEPRIMQVNENKIYWTPTTCQPLLYIPEYCLSTETLREVLFPVIDKHWGLEWVVSGVRIQTPLHIIHAVTTGHLAKAESIIQSLSDFVACAPHTLMTSYLSSLCGFSSPTRCNPFLTWPPPTSQASLHTIHQIQTHTPLCVVFWAGNSTL